MNCDGDALSDIFGLMNDKSTVCYLGMLASSSTHSFVSVQMPMGINTNRTFVPGAAHGFVGKIS